MPGKLEVYKDKAVEFRKVCGLVNGHQWPGDREQPDL